MLHYDVSSYAEQNAVDQNVFLKWSMHNTFIRFLTNNGKVKKKHSSQIVCTYKM